KLFIDICIDAVDYLSVDKSSDLPNDYYATFDDVQDTKPIYLQMPNKSLKELSKHSHIVEAISGKKRTDQKLYFPLEILDALPYSKEKRKIFSLLSRSEEHTSELQSR